MVIRDEAGNAISSTNTQGTFFDAGLVIEGAGLLVINGMDSRVRHQMTQVVDSYRACFKLATTKGSTGCFASVF